MLLYKKKNILLFVECLMSSWVEEVMSFMKKKVKKGKVINLTLYI